MAGGDGGNIAEYAEIAGIWSIRPQSDNVQHASPSIIIIVFI